MSTILKPLYGSQTALTITSLNSLANNGYAGCAVVDNTSALLDEALVSVTIATGSTGFNSGSIATVYAYGDVDATPHYSDGVTGTDATQTLTSPPNLRVIGQVNIPAGSTTYYGGPFPVAQAFNGRLPGKWGVVVGTSAGGTLAASGNSASYRGVQDQGV